LLFSPIQPILTPIVTYFIHYKRCLDWYLDLLTTYTTNRDCILPSTDTHRLVSLVYYILH
jgi:hypothetical protein